MGLFRKRFNTSTGAVEMEIPAGAPTMEPKMLDLTKKAAISLEKAGLGNQKAAVSLILDYSGSMSGFYYNGSVQHLAEQVLGLSVNLDDDGIVPTWFFHHDTTPPFDVSLNNYQGIIVTEMRKRHMGGTCYAPVMREAVRAYKASGASDPALMVFQTDGTPEDQAETERLLQEYASLPIFWAFVGFGPSIHFLKNLDTLRGRVVDNASFFHAEDPKNISDDKLYDGITGEFADWIGKARALRIL